MIDLISIIIPFFNAEKYIGATIQSALNQTYSNSEILCIDDGSTDNTVSIINSFKDSRIKLYQKENTGVSNTRNYGFNKAKGEFVLFLDSDDILCPTFIEDRISTLKKTGNIACCSEIKLINEEGNEISQETLLSVNNPSQIFNFKKNRISCPSAYLFNTYLLTKHKIYFNAKLQSSADKFYLLEIFKNESIDIIDSSPLYYRVLKNSMSHKISKNLILDYISFYHEVKKILSKEYNLNQAYYSGLCYTIGASSFYLNDYSTVAKYLIKSFIYSPKTLISFFLNKF